MCGREQEEQQEIARSKGSSGDEPLTWADTRRMHVTSRAIQETMRVASILSFTFREAVEDVIFGCLEHYAGAIDQMADWHEEAVREHPVRRGQALWKAIL